MWIALELAGTAGGQRLLIISLDREMVQEKYLEWWVGLFRLPAGNSSAAFLLLLVTLLKALP